MGLTDGLPREDLGVLEPPRLLELDVATLEQDREQLPHPVQALHHDMPSPPAPAPAPAPAPRGSSTRSIDQSTNQLTKPPVPKRSQAMGSPRRGVAGGRIELGRRAGVYLEGIVGMGAGLGVARRDRGPRGGQCKSRRGSGARLRGWARLRLLPSSSSV